MTKKTASTVSRSIFTPRPQLRTIEVKAIGNGNEDAADARQDGERIMDSHVGIEWDLVHPRQRVVHWQEEENKDLLTPTTVIPPAAT